MALIAAYWIYRDRHKAEDVERNIALISVRQFRSTKCQASRYCFSYCRSSLRWDSGSWETRFSNRQHFGRSIHSASTTAAAASMAMHGKVARLKPDRCGSYLHVQCTREFADRAAEGQASHARTPFLVPSADCRRDCGGCNTNVDLALIAETSAMNTLQPPVSGLAENEADARLICWCGSRSFTAER